MILLRFFKNFTLKIMEIHYEISMTKVINMLNDIINQ